VYEFDLFVRAYNPNGLSRSARVWSPDGPRLVVS
jgi:Tol biopolymer transport system component